MSFFGQLVKMSASQLHYLKGKEVMTKVSELGVHSQVQFEMK